MIKDHVLIKSLQVRILPRALWRGDTIGSELAWKTSGSVYSDWGFESPPRRLLISADMQKVKAGSL